MCSTVVCCNSIVLCMSVSVDRSGMVASTLFEGSCSAVLSLRFWSCFASHSWQIALELPHHGCDLHVWICKKHCVFRVNGASAVEKSWLACATVSGVVVLPSNLSGIVAHSGTEGSRWLAVFFVDAVLLCFACVEMLCALENAACKRRFLQ